MPWSLAASSSHVLPCCTSKASQCRALHLVSLQAQGSSGVTASVRTAVKGSLLSALKCSARAALPWRKKVMQLRTPHVCRPCECRLPAAAGAAAQQCCVLLQLADALSAMGAGEAAEAELQRLDRHYKRGRDEPRLAQVPGWRLRQMLPCSKCTRKQEGVEKTSQRRPAIQPALRAVRWESSRIAPEVPEPALPCRCSSSIPTRLSRWSWGRVHLQLRLALPMAQARQTAWHPSR